MNNLPFPTNSWNKLMLGCLTVTPLGIQGQELQRQDDDRPNILFILADDMGKECLGTYGSTYDTPNLDRLASEGIQFNCASSMPLSTPSRVQLYTGRYNYKNYSRFIFMNQDQRTFGNVAREAGYATAIAGKWQMGNNENLPQYFGFDNYCLWYLSLGGGGNRYAYPLYEQDGKVIADKTLDDYGPDYYSDYLLDFIEKNKDRPFLAFYPMALVHNPYQPTPEEDIWVADSIARLEHSVKNFPHMVHYVDKIVGKMLDRLKKLGILDNTIVIFAGDNGTYRGMLTPMKDGSYVRGGKSSTLETGTAVPFIVYWGKYKDRYRQHATDELVEFTDVFPTFAEAMQVDIPRQWDIDGQSLLPLLKGDTLRHHKDHVLINYRPQSSAKDTRGARYVKDRRYKLYHTGEFFDFVADPFEHSPLTNLTAEQQIVKERFEHYLAELPAWEKGNVPKVLRYTDEKRYTLASEKYYQKLDRYRKGVDIKEHLKAEKNIPFDDITPRDH